MKVRSSAAFARVDKTIAEPASIAAPMSFHPADGKIIVAAYN